jgi:hypothetical protein
MIIRLKAFSDSDEGAGRENLVNMAHVVWAERDERPGRKPCTVLYAKGGKLYVHETLDQIAEKVGGCP